MVINQVDVCGIGTIEPKNEPPVAGNCQREIPLIVSPQRMHPPTWKVEISRQSCQDERMKHAAQLGQLVWIQAPHIAFPPECAMSLMFDTFYHQATPMVRRPV
jgi:hypothetical protein